MTQEIFHNDIMRVSKDTKTLADFVREVMEKKNLTARKVQENSGGRITYSYVNKIKNGEAKKLSATTQEALARGLGVTTQEIFDLLRGKSLNGARIENERFFNLSEDYARLSPEDKREIEVLFRALEREVSERISPEQLEADKLKRMTREEAEEKFGQKKTALKK